MNDRLRQIAHQTFVLQPPPQLRYQRSGRYAFREGIAFVAYDAQDPSNNVAGVLGPVPEPDRVLALAEEFFVGRPGGWGVLVEAGAAQPIECLLRERGWRVAEEEPALVLTPIPAPPSLPPGLEIRRVTTAAELDDYYSASREGFSMAEGASADSPGGEDLTRAFIPSLACALDPEIAVFAGYLAGRPVAAAGVCRIGAVAEVFGVSVAPRARRRGFGTAITWAAVAEGAARGCSVAALRATPMGDPVYRRMGFEYACTFRTYAPWSAGETGGQ